MKNVIMKETFPYLNKQSNVCYITKNHCSYMCIFC